LKFKQDQQKTGIVNDRSA